MRRPQTGVCALAMLAGGCAVENTAWDPSLVAFDTVRVLGVADGSETETFGRITAIEPAGGGAFFLLDGQARAVSWFGADGTYRGGITARGEGPGELGFPTAIGRSSSGELLVLDPTNQRMSRFLASDSGLAYEDDSRQQIRGSLFCTLGDRVFLDVSWNGAAIVEPGDGAEPVRAFGTPITTPGLETLGPMLPMGEAMIPLGPIACTSQPDLIIIAGRSAPQVRAYTPEGDAVWETELADFEPVRLQLSDRGGVMLAPSPEGGAFWALTASRWDETLLLLQYAIRLDGPPPDGSEHHAVESRFLELATGAEVHRTRALPVIAATDGEYVFTTSGLPFPQVAVLRRR